MYLYKILILMIFSVGFIGCDKQSNSDTMEKENVISNWTSDKRKVYLKNRTDSTTWDKTMLENDLANKNANKELPLHNGVFPTTNYNLIDKESFKGIGNYGHVDYGIRVNNKDIIYQSFFSNRNLYNQSLLQIQKNEIFFQIIFLTDNIDTINYDHSSCQIISRNHPDYIGQGYFKTKNNKVSYVAFITAEGDSYAIVNTRLFNLTYGKTILIAPQKNGSFRSMQVGMPKISTDSIDKYTNELLKDESIVRFFLNPNNI